MQKKALILGGGVGGIVASNVLKKALGNDIDVTVVDKEASHYYASSYPLLLIGKRKPEDISRKLNRLERKGVKFFQARVTGLNLPGRQAVTNRGILPYDYLVIALGTGYKPENTPGFTENAYNIWDFQGVVKAREALVNFKEGHVVVFISSVPYKCPPAPYEIMFLLDQFFRQQGNRNKVKLTIITPDPTPEPLAGPLVGQSVRKMLAQKGIELRTEAKVLRIEPGAVILDNGKVTGDLFLGVPSHHTPEVLQNTGLVDDAGYVIVDQHTLQTNFPNVYAVGDATAIRLPVIGTYAPKAGIFAHYQSEVVARNIALLVRGKRPTYRYAGNGA